MSTEDQPEPPRTRAEARAAREAERLRRASLAQPVSSPAASLPALNAPQQEDPQQEESPRGSLSERSETKRVERAPASRNDDPAPPAIPIAPEPIVSVAPVDPTPPAATPAAPRFTRTLFAVIGILAVVVAGLAAVSLFQGPRLSDVQVDASEAIQVSGSRVILTANQSLAEIDESQVTVSPEVPFTLDATGRSIGIRFTVPLDDDTEYTVNVADATGVGGGPASNLTTSFTTPASEIFLLNRTDEDDTIFRADLAGDGVPVFAAERINDFRATATNLVVAVQDDEGSRILVMDRTGGGIREITLPGDGYVSSVQVSDRGGLVGYTYSDRELTDDSGRASVLVTQSLAEDSEPQIVQVGGEEASIAEWQFVPDSAAVLFIDFAGTLSLDDRSSDAGSQTMGIAMRLLGISRGTYTAIIEQIDGNVVEMNLADGSETPLAASDPDYGKATTITPFPGGTLRHVVARDEAGLPTGQAIIRVDDDGADAPILEVDAGNAILQACASPSGQYAAVTVAPNLADNAYDDMLVPLPKTVQTHLIDLRTGDEMVALTGFDVSWCQMAPSF